MQIFYIQLPNIYNKIVFVWVFLTLGKGDSFYLLFSPLRIGIPSLQSLTYGTKTISEDSIFELVKNLPDDFSFFIASFFRPIALEWNTNLD